MTTIDLTNTSEKGPILIYFLMTQAYAIHGITYLLPICFGVVMLAQKRK